MLIANVVGIEADKGGVYIVVLWDDTEYKIYIPKDCKLSISIDSEDTVMVEQA